MAVYTAFVPEDWVAANWIVPVGVDPPYTGDELLIVEPEVV